MRGNPVRRSPGPPTDNSLRSGDRCCVIRIVLAAVALNAIAPSARIAAQSRDPIAQVPPILASIVRIPVRSDSRLWLEGSSNIRDWTCKATTMEATIDVDEVGSAIHTHAIRGVFVKVPVRMLKCGDRHMEAEMYSALKAPRSEVTYIVARFDGIPQSNARGELMDTPGQLTVAGVERTVRMAVRSERLSDGSYRARGTVPILMTDFGIKPPRPWGGILRTADKVLIQFEIFIEPIT